MIEEEEIKVFFFPFFLNNFRLWVFVGANPNGERDYGGWFFPLFSFSLPFFFSFFFFVINIR